jgi:hypothetical protein
MPTQAIELLAKRVWYRSLVGIQKMRSRDAYPETSTIRSSPAIRLPQEIVEMIIAHLIFDKPSLCACSLTCYSWYIAAVAHLHHTVAIETFFLRDRKSRWPNPIRYMYMLGLLPLVKKLHIEYNFHRRSAVPPKKFRCCILRIIFRVNQRPGTWDRVPWISRSPFWGFNGTFVTFYRQSDLSP